MNLDLLILLTQELFHQREQNVMREENITKVVLNPNNPSKGKTDWKQVEGMTEEEIHAAALSDPDAQPATPEELEAFIVNLKNKETLSPLGFDPDLSGLVGAVFKRTGLECSINSKIYYKPITDAKPYSEREQK